MSSESPRSPRPRAPFNARALARLARRAGAIALEGHATGDTPAGEVRSVVRDIESLLSREAHAGRPRAQIALAHESGPLPQEEWVLTVDAIDGVDAYLAGLPTWSISLGLLRRGAPWSAAVCAPALGDLYVASSGTLRWQGKTVERPESGSRFVLGTGLEKRSILRLRKRREAEAPVSYHVCLVARGAAEGAILGRISIREAAPLACLLAPVGGELVSMRSGERIDLESLARGGPSRDPVLAAAAGRAAELVERLKKSAR